MQVQSLQDLLSNDSVWRVAGIAIVVGLLIGCAVVVAIVLFRRRQFWHGSLDELVGAKGTVEVPFDESYCGKVRLQVAHRTVGCIAYSGDAYQFSAGESVVVVGIRGDKVWVIPAAEFQETI